MLAAFPESMAPDSPTDRRHICGPACRGLGRLTADGHASCSPDGSVSLLDRAAAIQAQRAAPTMSPAWRPFHGTTDRTVDAVDSALTSVVSVALLPVLGVAIGVRMVIDRLLPPRDQSER